MCAISGLFPKQERQQRRNDATGQGFNVLNVSGNWDNGARAGAFLFDANNSASDANSNIGFRLANNNHGQKFGQSTMARSSANYLGALSVLAAGQGKQIPKPPLHVTRDG